LEKTKRKPLDATAFAFRRSEFSKSKLAMSLDYIFGKGTSKALNYSNLTFQYSRRTGRMKYVLENNGQNVLFSLRPNGSIAPSLLGFSMLLSKVKLKNMHDRPRWSVTVIDSVSPIVSEGKTVFCKHVVYCSDLLRSGEDVVILNEKGEVLAVGRSMLAGPTIKQFKRGAAVKVREGI
jgi:conserved protein with predicted RNA binding PUA domain